MGALIKSQNEHAVVLFQIFRSPPTRILRKLSPPYENAWEIWVPPQQVSQQ